MIDHLFLYLFFVIVFFILFYDMLKMNGKGYIKTYNIVFIFIAVITAFRYGTGMDTGNYMVAYSYMPKIQDINAFTFITFRFQPLYTLLCCLCMSVTDDFTLMQVVHVLIYYPALYLLLKRLGLRKFYILLLFFCYPYFVSGQSAIREGLALGFCFYALLFYFQNKWIPYYILVTIGFGFHTGAILFYMLPLVKLYCIKVHLSLRGFIYFIGAFLLTSMLFFYVQSHYHLDTGDNNLGRYQIENNGISILTLLRNLCAIIILYIFCFKKKYEQYRDLIYLGVLYVMIDLISSSFLPILYRFSAHLMVFFFFCVKLLFNEVYLKKNAIAGLICAFIMFYQPIARYYSLMSGELTGPLLKYCSVFASEKEKSYFTAQIINSTAADYFE